MFCVIELTLSYVVVVDTNVCDMSALAVGTVVNTTPPETPTELVSKLVTVKLGFTNGYKLPL